MSPERGFLAGGRRRPLPRVWFPILGGVLAILLVMPPAAAWARSGKATTSKATAKPRLAATCKLHVINGLNVPGQFPPSLRHLRRHLTAQPFKVFLSFKLLGVTSMNLATGRIARAKLAGPYHLEGQLISQVLADGRKQRLRFELALYRSRTRFRATKRMVKTTLLLDRGGTFFFVGPPHKGGKLVIGITCR